MVGSGNGAFGGFLQLATGGNNVIAFQITVRYTISSTICSVLALSKVSVPGPLFTKACFIGVGKLQLKNLYLQKKKITNSDVGFPCQCLVWGLSIPAWAPNGYLCHG